MKLYLIVDYGEGVTVNRRYVSPRRQEQARQTRRAILDAAAKLFVDPGYAATPLTAVAAEAGVAVQTVYAVFGNKRQLLSDLVDVTLVGDDERITMAERSFVADIRALTGLRAKLTRYARHLTETHARQVHVMLALAGAATADADAAAIWRKNLEDRRRGMVMFAADLAATGEVLVSQERAADMLWLAQDIRNYDWLVRERGWPVERFERWFVDGVAAVLGAPD
ncbi:TetR family transcriptional regulator [Actinoplanes lobatus]|uniref:TetR family transcriptional regulator n=1 Tax=Actinoplanes lobatus TaxID=113568 RepID=A0ABQ4AKE4_9ACTN|nr:TetR family transcriptional regulator [Actinoplanes lobatus]GIE40979.1 TetR family transcriptional regulator [Actinoplanes lobatus]